MTRRHWIALCPGGIALGYGFAGLVITGKPHPATSLFIMLAGIVLMVIVIVHALSRERAARQAPKAGPP